MRVTPILCMDLMNERKRRLYSISFVDVSFTIVIGSITMRVYLRVLSSSFIADTILSKPLAKESKKVSINT